MSSFFARFRSLFCVLLVASMLLITGCTPKDPATNVAAGETGKLKIWVSGEYDFLNALALEFSSKNAGAVQVSVVSFDSDEALQGSLIDLMSEATGPDIIYTSGEWIYQSKNKLVPLTGDQTFTAQSFRDAFVKAAEDTLIIDEQLYGVPMGIDTLGVFYNEEHLISRLADRDTPGVTWNEFQSSAQQLTRTDNSFDRFETSGAAIGRVDNINYGWAVLENLFVQMGVDLFSEDGTEAVFASRVGVTPEGKQVKYGVEAVEFYTGFADSRYKQFSWSELLASDDDVNKDFTAFVEGNASMVFGYARDYQRIQDLIRAQQTVNKKVINESQVRAALLPQFNDPRLSNERDIVAEVRALAVPRSTQSPATAWRFLKFAVQKENMRSFYEKTSLPTPRLDLVVEQQGTPVVGVFAQQAKFARANLMRLPRTEVEVFFEDFIQKVNDGEAYVSSGLIDLERTMTALLRKKIKLEKQIRPTPVQ